jgi:eukaryotic-like serine/threonine-protein kinase
MIELDTSQFALTRDAIATRVGDLPEAIRAATESIDTDVIWTQSRSRSTSFVVGADAAELLRQFDHPVGIANAVFRFSAARVLDSSQVLRDAYPLLREAVDRGLLVSESEWNSSRLESTLSPGEVVAQWTIQRCIQSLVDGEVYEARNQRGDRVALKIARSAEAARRQDHERRVLEWLAGRVHPRLVDSGMSGTAQYLAIEWRDGQPPNVLAEQLRAAREFDRTLLLRLSEAIVHAYRTLHREGLVHGDVHPMNMVVERDWMVTLLDFEVAREINAPSDGRGYVAYYLEPEMARAMLEGTMPPPASPRGEQFAIGALLFELFTGERYADFRLENERFLRQVCNDSPRSFAACGVRPWPAIERILARALAKEPSDRYEDLDELYAALGTVRFSAERHRSTIRPHRRWLRRQLLDLAPEGDALRRTLDQTPRSSLYYGLAGPALVHLRLADQRRDPDHLASADCWCARAEYLTSDPDAYSSPSMREAHATPSEASLLHGPAGVALTRAMIGNARADGAELDRACRWFLRSASARCSSNDLTLGKSGVLFGAAAFLDMQSLGADERDSVLRLGRKTATALTQWTERVGGPRTRSKWRNLGLAHGWAGILYSLIRWAHSDPATPLPSRMPEWLDALAARGQRVGRRMRWPWVQDGTGPDQMVGYAPGWCNGSAGLVILWAAAYRALGREEDLHRMVAVALDTWLSDTSEWGLCCGTTGRAFALLSAGRVTGENRWMSRARTLASRAVQFWESDNQRENTHSLFRGDSGLTLLLAELEQPNAAVFPIFESHL